VPSPAHALSRSRCFRWTAKRSANTNFIVKKKQWWDDYKVDKKIVLYDATGGEYADFSVLATDC
jgi:hypothetical protein